MPKRSLNDGDSVLHCLLLWVSEWILPLCFKDACAATGQLPGGHEGLRCKVLASIPSTSQKSVMHVIVFRAC